MSQKYDQYLQEHKENVYKGFEYIRDNLPELLTEDITEWQYRFGHDLSKSDPEEYDAYDAYFYGGNRSYKVVNDFKYAWLRHIHNNPHHPQYWIYYDDDKNEVIKLPFSKV